MVGVEFAIQCGADVAKYSLGKCKARSRCGDGALAIARCTAHPSGSGDIRRRTLYGIVPVPSDGEGAPL